MTSHGPLRQHRVARPTASESAVEATPTRSRALKITGFIGALLLVVLFGLVGFHAIIVANQSRIDQLDSDIDSARRAQQALELQVAQLESPDRIRAEALTRLGMIEPETVAYLEPVVMASPVTADREDEVAGERP